jgi:uncharacterized protein YprB with RNaseH-like and TPR domain
MVSNNKTLEFSITHWRQKTNEPTSRSGSEQHGQQRFFYFDTDLLGIIKQRKSITSIILSPDRSID